MEYARVVQPPKGWRWGKKVVVVSGRWSDPRTVRTVGRFLVGPYSGGQRMQFVFQGGSEDPKSADSGVTAYDLEQAVEIHERG